MAKPALSINLLHDREQPLLDKFLQWALSSGRMIVILTEVIALSAFLYRFSLDRKIVDLNDEISQKQIIVEQFNQQEVLYRNLQTRLANAKSINTASGETTTLLNQVVTLATGRIRFNSLTVNENVINIDGETPSTTQLNYFIRQLQQNPKVERVSLDKLDNRTSRSTIEVGISAYLKTQTKKPATKNLNTQ
jgi:Tfp pilus assembly protein PilN